MKPTNKKKLPQSSCDSCVFYEYDEYMDENVCTVNLDEDDMVRYMSGTEQSCPYYRYYDEYKSVQKQI